ncbi:MAG: hypothetical protein ACRD0J_16365 [Acidimicrobiales bacterium]
MSLWAFASLSGSPGVTTTAVLAGACAARRALVVEADPFGSALSARFGLAPRPGLSTLVAARRDRSPEAPWAHAQVLPGGLEVLVGLPSVAQTLALHGDWAELGETLAALDGLAIADMGRLLPGPPAPLALARAAQALAVVVRPSIAEAARVRAALPLLHALNENLGLVVIGRHPYGPEEVSRATGVEVFGVLADDPAGAGLAGGRTGSPRALRRSALVRSVAGLVRDMETRAGRPAGARDQGVPGTAGETAPEVEADLTTGRGR